MPRLHVAVLDEELPYPLTSGKRIRTYHLLARLALRHRLTYLCHRNTDPDEALRAAQHFADLGIAVRVVERAVSAKSGPAFYARLAGNLFHPWPYTVASHTSPELQRAADELAADDCVDVWHCEWTPYSALLRDRPGRRWLVVAHNVESLIWQRYYETEEQPARRWYIKKQWEKFERFERWAYGAAGGVVAVSEADSALIRERFGARRVWVVDNGVDTDYFAPAADGPARDEKRILFLGSLDWRPNLDAVKLLLDQIFPAVRAAEPAARLCLVGRRPPDWLRRACAEQPGVELHADVPDVRPFLARCGMLAVPLRIGGGSRLKILEALATGTPVVSTKVGAEGLRLTPGRDLIVTDGPGAMAGAIVEGIRRPEELQDTGEDGRRTVASRYDWGPLADRLDAVWQAAAREGARTVA